MRKIISNTERRVLKTMIENEEELTGYEITKKIYNITNSRVLVNRKNYIYKILENLEKRGIVIKKNSYPSFFRLNEEIKNNLRKEIIQFEIQCPKCKELLWADDEQITKQCHCFTRNGKFTRFWLSPSRYTGRKKII